MTLSVDGGLLRRAAQGSASSRFSQRNRVVARKLQDAMKRSGAHSPTAACWWWQLPSNSLIRFAPLNEKGLPELA